MLLIIFRTFLFLIYILIHDCAVSHYKMSYKNLYYILIFLFSSFLPRQLVGFLKKQCWLQFTTSQTDRFLRTGKKKKKECFVEKLSCLLPLFLCRNIGHLGCVLRAVFGNVDVIISIPKKEEPRTVVWSLHFTKMYSHQRKCLICWRKTLLNSLKHLCEILDLMTSLIVISN